MFSLIHSIASWYLKKRIQQIEHFIQYPQETQQFHFEQLIFAAKDTVWGRKYGYESIQSIETFQSRVPVSTYEQLFPFIERSLKGEANVLWPGKTTWFAKSSGTTNNRSKFIPLSQDSIEDCHYKAGKDMVAMYLHNYPGDNLFGGKTLSIGGSHEISSYNEHARYGDISAVLTENLPPFFQFMRTPSKKVAIMAKWEEKIEAMARETMDQDVTAIVGVPTWTIVLINRIFELKGIEDRDLLKVWPNLEAFFHGGVSFKPYRKQFADMDQAGKMSYIDCYNASEGFFGIQYQPDVADLLLMLDYGIFYEFIPMSEFGKRFPSAHTLDEVEVGINYALVISTNGGLWRYMIGDTIQFTSLSPFRFKISGRTKHFINAFGEELIVDNAEEGIAEACEETGAMVSNFTAAPIYLDGTKKGGHEWLIEFEKIPDSMAHFRDALDAALRRTNSDYDAKREGDLALEKPLLHTIEAGTFHEWMKGRGRLGGQNKVPRLSNDREYVEDILKMIEGEGQKN